MFAYKRLSGVAALAAALALWTVSRADAQTATLYVDPDIPMMSCATYNPQTRACSGGSATAHLTLAGAAAAASAGDIVDIREGVYREALNPPRSGREGSPIVFRRHEGETPTITGVDIGITIISREYIDVDGLTVAEVNGWVRLQDAKNITIRNSTFRHVLARGTTGSIKLVRSTLNRIQSNTLEEGTDSIVLVDAADRNVIEDNSFTTARHSLISIRCSSFNVIRGNRFANRRQKALEIYDCEGVGSDNPVRDDSTKHNLIEQNEVTMTRGSNRDHQYNGIQHGAQYTIVRRNVFRDNAGGGVNFQEYANESRYVYGNRMYHNTFYANRCHAIIGDYRTSHYRDQRAVNNLLYKNVSCNGGSDQTNIPDKRAVVLESNAIEKTDPGFVDEPAHDFRLTPNSRMIDLAAPLTTTTAAGSGTTMVVKDALYFYAGHGIPGEKGDEIQLIGGPAYAVITAIDYATHRLTLDRPLTWSAGQGVALRYAGAAPDMGAFEFSAAQRSEASR